MTDMRATERLLEVIAEHAPRLAINDGDIYVAPDELVRRQKEIIEAITELRRRGDTLVRADDLREVMSLIDSDETSWAYTGKPAAQVKQSVERLDNALGGVL